MITMPKFTQKPRIVEAMQYNGLWSGNGENIAGWVGVSAGWTLNGLLQLWHRDGTLYMSPGDWIVKADGEWSIVDRSTFAKSFEPAL